jgi:hypothetical protein
MDDFTNGYEPTNMYDDNFINNYENFTTQSQPEQHKTPVKEHVSTPVAKHQQHQSHQSHQPQPYHRDEHYESFSIDQQFELLGQTQHYENVDEDDQDQNIHEQNENVEHHKQHENFNPDMSNIYDYVLKEYTMPTIQHNEHIGSSVATEEKVVYKTFNYFYILCLLMIIFIIYYLYFHSNKY